LTELNKLVKSFRHMGAIIFPSKEFLQGEDIKIHPVVQWTPYQHKYPSDNDLEYHDNLFNNEPGIKLQVMTGDLYNALDTSRKTGDKLICLDIDNKVGREEFSSLTNEELANTKGFLVDVDPNNPYSVHVFALIKGDIDIADLIPNSGKGKQDPDTPMIEIMSNSKSLIVIRNIVGDSRKFFDKLVYTDTKALKERIENIRTKYKDQLKNGHASSNTPRIPISISINHNEKIYNGQRHTKMFPRACDIIRKNLGKLTYEGTYKLVESEDLTCCIPPIQSDDKDLSVLFKSAWDRVEGDIEAEQKYTSGSDGNGETRIYSVKEACRIHKIDNCIVKGDIVSAGELFKMAVVDGSTCVNCGSQSNSKPKNPVYLQSLTRSGRCTECSEQTVRADFHYINATQIELRNLSNYNDMDKMGVLLFDDNTLDIVIGDTVKVSGNIDIIQTRFGKGKPVSMMFSDTITYEGKDEIKLSDEDIQELTKFKEDNKDNLIDKLVEKTTPSVIGNEPIKKGILLSAVNTTIDTPKRKKRINILIVGPPGLDKTGILLSATELIPGSSFEGAQSSSGLSLTAMVVVEDDTKFLSLGPIPRCQGAFCAINELNRSSPQNQGQLLDPAQEGLISLSKYNINAKIRASTTIIASANPVNEDWKDGIVSMDQVTIIPQLLDRFDLKFILKKNKDFELSRKYAQLKSEDIISDDDSEKILQQKADVEFMQKYILHAKQYKPKFSEEARHMINEYYVVFEQTNSISKRPFETLYNLAAAFAKLKFKDTVDVKEAEEAIDFYSKVTEDYNTQVQKPKNPIDVTFTTCVEIVKKFGRIESTEIIDKACEEDPQVSSYIGPKHHMNQTRKVATIIEMLQNHSHIERVGLIPIVLQWVKCKNVLCCERCVCDKEMGAENISNDDNATNNEVITTKTDKNENMSDPENLSHSQHTQRSNEDKSLNIQQLIKLPGTQQGTKISYNIEPIVGDLSVQNNFIGGHLRMRAETDGAYPTNYLEFIDNVFGPEPNTIEVCSRTVKGLNQDGNVFTVDINPEFKPDLVADGQDLSEIPANKFSRYRADPPYNTKNAREMYNTELPNVSKLLKEGSRIVKPGSLLFLLHATHGPASIGALKRIGYLSISAIPNNETRILNIYLKQDKEFPEIRPVVRSEYAVEVKEK
jgi:DNA replicative helicase MCM subunit Mcm2 (Cdc46/Mcm family)